MLPTLRLSHPVAVLCAQHCLSGCAACKLMCQENCTAINCWALAAVLQPAKGLQPRPPEAPLTSAMLPGAGHLYMLPLFGCCRGGRQVPHLYMLAHACMKYGHRNAMHHQI